MRLDLDRPPKTPEGIEVIVNLHNHMPANTQLIFKKVIETASKITELYIWLGLRFPESFPDKGKATEVRTEA